MPDKKQRNIAQVDWPMIVSILLLIFAAILPITWFEPGHIIYRGDPVFALDPVRYFLERFSLWNGKMNLGSDLGVSTAPIIHQFIQAIPGFFGADDRVSEMFHFSFWFVLPGITIGLFVDRLAKQLAISRWAIPVAIVFYLFNLYRLAIFGDNNHFAIYSALPLGLYCLTYAFNNDDAQYKAAAGLALTSLLVAQAGTNPPMYLMFWLPVIIYGSVLMFTSRQPWRKSLVFWAVLLFATILVNLFWLAPFLEITFRQTSLAGAGNLNWLDDLSKHTSLAHVTRLIGAWSWFDTWRGEPYAPYAAIYQKPFWQTLTLIPAILALLVLLQRKIWNRTTSALLVIGLIGLIFSQGTHPPFGVIFEFFAHHVPFFWIFRSPWYKFSNLLAFSYATLIALGVGYWLTALSKTRIKPLGAIILIPIIVLPLVIAHPFLTGRFIAKKKDVSHLAPESVLYPKHIRAAADWLNDQPGNTAVALLPYQGAAVFRWGFATLIDPFVNMSRRPVFLRGDRIGYVPGETPGASIAYRVFVDRLYSDDPSALKVAQLLGIEYVIVRNDIFYEFYDDTDSPTIIKQRLAKIPGITFRRSFGEWDIYQLPTIKENPLYTTNWLRSFAGHPLDSLGQIVNEKTADDPWPVTVFSRPVKQPYPDLLPSIESRLNRNSKLPELSIKQSGSSYIARGNSNEPFLLVLNQTYDPSWIVKVDSASASQPIIVNGYSPAWLVSPSGEFKLEVSYSQQRLVVPFILISALVSLSLFASLFATRKKKH